MKKFRAFQIDNIKEKISTPKKKIINVNGIDESKRIKNAFNVNKKASWDETFLSSNIFW